MPGVSWLKCPRTLPFKPGVHRAQRFVHLATLLPRWRGYRRALPLRWVPVFPPKAVPGAAASRKDWEAALVELCWLRAKLDAAGRAAQDVLGPVDGSCGGCPAGRWPTAER